MDAEIISKKKENNGTYRFYVHYIDCNRRLDEWVSEEKLDLNTVRVPQRVKKSISTQSFNSTISEQQQTCSGSDSFLLTDGQRYIVNLNIN